MRTDRSIFGDEDGARRRRRLLVGAATAQATGLLLVLLSVVGRLPVAVEAAAILLASAAVAMTTTALRRFSRDDERRRAHAEATIDLAGSMLMALDTGGRIRMANPAACAVFGRDEAEILGEHVHERIVAGEDAGASRAALARVLSGEIDPAGYRSVRTVVRPDGTERQVAWTFTVRRGDDGAITGLVLCGEDITAQLRREAADRTERADLEQLHRLAQDIASVDDARSAITDRIRAMVGASFVGLAERTASGVTYTTATIPELRGRTVARGEESGCLRVLETGERLVVDDAPASPYVFGDLIEQTGCTAMRFEPVRSGDQVVAVLAVGWVDGVPTIDGRREQLLALAADETAIAINRLRTLSRLEEIALTDPLTGVANRRAFDAELARAIARADRGGAPLTLAVLDLNEFKALNDRSGHDAGDALLAACSGAWEAELRTGDMLARLGGDEFAFVLPDCDAAAAAAVIARLRAATPHTPGAAIGAVTWADQTPFELYQLADRALYRDKDTRRRARLADDARLAAIAAAEAALTETQDSVESIAAEARELLGLPNVYVNLVGADETRHVVRPEADPHARRPTSEVFCQHVVTSGRPFVFADSHEEARVSRTEHADLARAYAGMPLADEDGNVLGALCVTDDRPREWDATELRVLDKLALRVARELTAHPREPAS